MEKDYGHSTAVRNFRSAKRGGFPPLPTWFPAILLSGFLLFFAAPLTSAAENWRGFYDALIQRGYYDVAIDYLESFRGQENIPPDLAPEMDRLLGTASLEVIRTAATKAERDLFTQRAKDYLTRFLSEHPDNDFAYDANGALGDIYMEMGNAELARIQKGVSDAEKSTIYKTVQDYFAQAKVYIDQGVEQAKEVAKRWQSDESRANSPEANQIYGEYLNLRIQGAELVMKLAMTFPSGSEKWKTGLTAAREGFGQLYEKYNRYPGGFKARLLEAKAARELGQKEEAFEFLEEINSLQMTAALYSIKTEAILLFDEMAMEEAKPADLFKMIDLFNDWKIANELPPLYYSTMEGLRIHLLTGQAALKLMELKAADKNAYQKGAKEAFAEKKTTAMKLLNKPEQQAYEWFDFVYRQKSPLSLEAEKLLSNPVFRDKIQEGFSSKPHNFEEALQKVNRSWTDFIQANLEAEDAMGAETTDAAEARKVETAETADRCIRWSFELAGRNADRDKLDTLRLQWATLNLLAGRWDDAEILADFILFRRPGSPLATKAAEISLHAVRNAFQDGKKIGSDESTLARLDDAVQNKANYILKRWGNGFSGNLLPIVQEAILVQMDTAIGTGDIEKAKGFLEAIQESSPVRATAELQLGQSLWANYVDLIQLKKENPESVSEEKMESMISSARDSLSKGLEQKLIQTNGGRGDDFLTVCSALSLAQIDVTLGLPDDAFKWLTHPNIGPLTLVEKRLGDKMKASGAADASDKSGDADEPDQADAENGANGADSKEESAEGPEGAKPTEGGESADQEKVAHSIAAGTSGLNEQFQLSTLTLALRVLVAMNDFDRAERVMTGLESFINEGKGDEQRLTVVYLQLGKQLQDQIQILRQGGETDPTKAERLKTVSQGFEGFLDRISKRTEGNTYFTLRWVGDTFFSFGLGLKPIGGSPGEIDPDSKSYFEKAGRTYQTILKRIEADPSWAPNENAKLLTTLRMADCLREIGKYGNALKALLPLMAANENNLEIQFAAAGIFQEWGVKERVCYVRAIQGGVPKPNGRNTVWGWNRIISILSRNIDKSKQYKEKFYEAVVHKMECRLAWMTGISDQAERVKQAQNGETELTRLYKVHPDLGGPTTYKKLENFLKRFRSEAGGDSETGFVPNSTATPEDSPKNLPAPTEETAPAPDQENRSVADNSEPNES